MTRPCSARDPVASCVIPKDGPYIIEVRESAYGGTNTSYYRLHIGTFPRPLAVYPAGGMVGEELTVHYLADDAGADRAEVRRCRIKRAR